GAGGVRDGSHPGRDDRGNTHLRAVRRRGLATRDGRTAVAHARPHGSTSRSPGSAPAWRGRSSPRRSQASWLEVQMCAAGTIASGRSILPTVTSTELGRAVSRKVRAVPQAAQSWRTARGVARSSAGVPAVKAKAAAGNVAQVTNGAPVVRRQMLQWQWVTSPVVALTR